MNISTLLCCSPTQHAFFWRLGEGSVYSFIHRLSKQQMKNKSVFPFPEEGDALILEVWRIELLCDMMM